VRYVNAYANFNGVSERLQPRCSVGIPAGFVSNKHVMVCECMHRKVLVA
jgi:hypothetical protein